MTKSYLIGIDFGTGGGKACIIDEEADVLAYSFREYPIYVDKPGWSEHDAELYWTLTCEMVKECLNETGISPNKVKCIGLSSAQPCMVMVDEEHNPINRAYNLMDRRATNEVQWLKDNIGEDHLFSVSANRLEDHPTLANLLWEKNNRPDDFARIWKALTIDGYVRLKMTGVAAMCYSAGVFMGVSYDIKNKRFDENIMNKMGINPDIMPSMHPCQEIVGHLTAKAAKELGLVEGIPVCAGQVDCNAGWIGGGAVDVGDMHINLGTCGVMGVVNNSLDFSDAFLNTPYTTNNCDDFVTIGVALTGGHVLRYMRDAFCDLEVASTKLTPQIDAYDLMNMEAESIPAGCQGLIFLPYLMGERTVLWDVHARGVLFGLSMHHTKAHMIRAMMEGVAYALYHNFQEMQKQGIKINYPIILNEGGAKSKLWRQIITDVFNVPTAFVENRVGAPYGDAILAGVATGVFKGFDVAKDKAKYIAYTEPNAETHERYMEYYKIYRKLYERVKDLYTDLATLRDKYAPESYTER